MDEIINENWELDHVAHAVNDLNKSLAFYVETLGFNLSSKETLADELIEAAFLKLDNSTIELIAPLPGNTKVKKFLDKRGEGLHHICFRVPSVQVTLDELVSKGVKTIDKKPRRGARGKNIAFLQPSSAHGVLIELCSN